MLFLKLCLNCGHYVFMQMSCLFWSLIEDPFNFSVHEMFHQKTCLEISVKHAWKSVFIISGVTFFFFSVPSMRLSRCISILCSCAYSRTRANLVCDHVQALLIDMLICSVCTVRVSELLKTSQIVISISADSRESLDLMLYCVTGIFSFKRASYYIIVCNWDKLSQWSRDNAPTYAQFTLQVSVDAMSSAFVTTSMCSVSGL